MKAVAFVNNLGQFAKWGHKYDKIDSSLNDAVKAG